MSAKTASIVSLLPSATEIVCALGLEDRLSGVTHECDHPAGVRGKPHLTSSKILRDDMNSREIDHAVRSQLDGHGSIYSLDEKLLGEISPDLIITQELCDVCAVSYKIVQKAARVFAADATVVSLEPVSVEDIFSNIVTVGELTGRTDEASKLVNSLRKRLDLLRSRTRAITQRPRVLMLEWLDPPFAPGHWVPEQVDAAGGTCVLGEPGKRSVTTTFTALAESKADILVLIPCGYGIEDILRQLGSTTFPYEMADIPAILNNRVWAVDASSYFSRPGPRVVDGAEILARIVHPSIFGKPGESEAVNISSERFHYADQRA